MTQPNTTPELRVAATATATATVGIVVAGIHHIVVFVGTELAFLGRGGLEALLGTRVRIADLQRKGFVPDRISMEVFDDLITDLTRFEP